VVAVVVATPPSLRAGSTVGWVDRGGNVKALGLRCTPHSLGTAAALS